MTSEIKTHETIDTAPNAPESVDMQLTWLTLLYEAAELHVKEVGSLQVEIFEESYVLLEEIYNWFSASETDYNPDGSKKTERTA